MLGQYVTKDTHEFSLDTHAGLVATNFLLRPHGQEDSQDVSVVSPGQILRQYFRKKPSNTCIRSGRGIEQMMTCILHGTLGPTLTWTVLAGLQQNAFGDLFLRRLAMSVDGHVNLTAIIGDLTAIII